MAARVVVTLAVMAGCSLTASPRWQPDGGASACGDFAIDANEVCDDGNTVGGDGCSAECTSDESCGNGMTDVNELCDDGNAVDGDDCSANCRSDESCGNGVVDLARGETCDDGNSISSDGCANNCQSNEACGNAVLDPQTGEVCDPGNNIATAICDPDCSAPNCGDSYANSLAGEPCDSGGVNTPACDFNCTPNMCGDNYRNPTTEACDSGGVNTPACDFNCTTNMCGDNYRNPTTEACDSGGINTSTCDSDCTARVCGDNFVNSAGGEACDQGGGDTSSCDADCTTVICGDGYLNGAAGEQCDDGNMLGGDTCSPTCQGTCAPSREICGDGLDQDCAGGDPACPPNDAPGDAIDISGGGLFTTSLDGARDDHTGIGCGSSGGSDVFYTFSLGAPEVVYFDTFGSDFNSVTRLLSGPCSALGGQLSCADNACSTLQSQDAGQLGAGTYCIVVDQAAYSPNGVSSLRFRRGGRTGTVIATGSGTVSGSTTGKSNETVPSCSTQGPAPDVGYYFLSCPAQTLTVNATTCAPGTNYDSMLYVRTSTQAQTACNDDDPGCALSGVSSTLSQSTVSGPDLHWLIVDGYDSDYGTYELNYSIQ